MFTLPKLRLPDSTLPLFLEGYDFISNRCREQNTRLFETRLMLFKVVCMRGEAAARIFYDNNRFQREGAMPNRGRETLVGKRSIQNLDGEAHRHRKQMLMSLMTPERIEQLTDIMADHWHAYAHKWEKQDSVFLFREVNELLCRSVCAWAGVPLDEAEVERRTNDFMAMIDSAAAIGPRHWLGRLSRNAVDYWLADVIEAVRNQTIQAPADSAAAIIAAHRDADGNLLETQAAAQELNNILRPTIAVARYIIFIAHALQEHPEYREKLQQGSDEDLTHFVQEVRRFYPFFPVAAAIVKQPFDWEGVHFPKGRWVLLDLYGTSRDAEAWEAPDEFRPERFRQWDGSPYNFVPQGGGDHFQNHRCAGEWLTISLMKRALQLLLEMRYEVPPQDLRIDTSRIPAIPNSRFVIAQVKSKPSLKSVESKKRAATSTS